jgi:hypothetical protein
VLELDAGLAFKAEDDAEFFSLLPARPVVCLIEPREENAEPYLLRTADLRRRLQRLLGPADPASKRLNLREFARAVHYRETGSAFEQALTYYRHAKQNFPKRYRDLMRLRPAAVLKVNLRNAYPRCYATRRIAVDEQGLPTAGAYYGPFASRRAAQAFAEKMLDFFKVRRCQIKIRRDPAFPGCLYSEMKMCLAPCFAGCTKEEYDVEVNRLVSFLETSGGSLRGGFETERERRTGFRACGGDSQKGRKTGGCAAREAGTGAEDTGPGCCNSAAHSAGADDRGLCGKRRAVGGTL